MVTNRTLLLLDEALASIAVFVIVSGSDWWAETLLNEPIQDPTLIPKPRVEKSPFQILANQLEVDKNVDRAQFRMRWMVAN